MNNTGCLEHHGIKGQRWGTKNGPPYPLDRKTHNRVVKKAKAGELSDKGKIVVYSAITAVSLAKMADALGMFENGRRKIADKLDSPVTRSKTDLTQIRKKGKSYDEIDDQLIRTINGKHHYKNTNGGKINCLSCSLAYISDTVAYEKGNKEYGAKPGYFAENTGTQSDEKVGIHSVLNNVKSVYDINREKGLKFDEAAKKIPKNSTGMLFINGDSIFTYGGHAINYESDKKGNITIIDSQEGKKYTYKEFQRVASQYDMNKVCAIYDCSNSTVNHNSEMLDKIFK